MAVWSKVLPMTASCLSSMHGIPAGACEKVASDLRLAGGFRRVIRFLPPLTTG